MECELFDLKDRILNVVTSEDQFIRIVYGGAFDNFEDKHIPPKIQLDSITNPQSNNIKTHHAKVRSSGCVPVCLFRTRKFIPLSWNPQTQELKQVNIDYGTFEDWMERRRKMHVGLQTWQKDVDSLIADFKAFMVYRGKLTRSIPIRRSAVEKVEICMLQLRQAYPDTSMIHKEATMVLEYLFTCECKFGKCPKPKSWYSDDMRYAAEYECGVEREAFIVYFRSVYSKLEMLMIKHHMHSTGTDLFDEFEYVFPPFFKPVGIPVYNRYKLFMAYVEARDIPDEDT